MIYKGDSVTLKNLEQINNLYCLNLPDGDKWELTGIIPKAEKGFRLFSGINQVFLTKQEGSFLFTLRNRHLGVNMVLTFEELQSCATDIHPVKRPRFIKLCSQSI